MIVYALKLKRKTIICNFFFTFKSDIIITDKLSISFFRIKRIVFLSRDPLLTRAFAIDIYPFPHLNAIASLLSEGLLKAT